MTRTHPLIPLSLCLLFLSSPVISADEIYRGYSVRRYDVVWERSLFKVSHSNDPDVTLRWTLSGVFRFEGGHGAVILNRESGQFLQVETGRTNDEGFRLVNIESRPDGTPIRVQVAHEGVTFWVTNLSR